MAGTFDQPHEEVLTVHLRAMLDAHDQRVDTPDFEHTKHQLVHVEDQGCYICGSKESREVHHFHVERCLAQMIEWGPGSQIRSDFPAFPWDTAKSIYEFIDSPLNCRVYCKEHHTGKVGSIHHWPHPMQNAMRYMAPATRDRYTEKGAA